MEREIISFVNPALCIGMKGLCFYFSDYILVFVQVYL